MLSFTTDPTSQAPWRSIRRQVAHSGQHGNASVFQLDWTPGPTTWSNEICDDYLCLTLKCTIWAYPGFTPATQIHETLWSLMAKPWLLTLIHSVSPIRFQQDKLSSKQTTLVQATPANSTWLPLKQCVSSNTFRHWTFTINPPWCLLMPTDEW